MRSYLLAAMGPGLPHGRFISLLMGSSTLLTQVIRMVSIAVTGPTGSHAWQAARQHDPDADLRLFPRLGAVFTALAAGEADLALAPVFNTREGQIRESLHLIKSSDNLFWCDNLVLPIHLSLGSRLADHPIDSLLCRNTDLPQCEDFLNANFPDSPITAVHDLDKVVRATLASDQLGLGVIAAEESLLAWGLKVRAREISPHNRTRFAVLGRTPAARTGYDATTLITTPIKDRVGMLADILGEFTNRSINLLDMQTETDPQSQKLQFFIELEGHLDDLPVREALKRIESRIIQESGSVRVLGSFPRVDMRAKRIKRFGFIGSGEMSTWFAERLAGEGYQTVVTGRQSTIRPEAMIPSVEVVVICVPISATPVAIEQYGPLLQPDQALILLAGAAEGVINTALTHTDEGVEVLLVHNLWGPQAASMKDKNATIVRTSRSGVLCSEFEAFLYKHGARITIDSPEQHDLMMGVGQKLPTAIAVAFAMTLKDQAIPIDAIGSHATLTSLYPILSMARVHAQNPRTYAEILTSSGQGNRLIDGFAENLEKILRLSAKGEIAPLCQLIDENRSYLTDSFLKNRMRQALAVDETLGRMIDRE